MASEQVMQVLEAEERARQAELNALEKGASIKTQAGREAEEILAKEHTAAKKQMNQLLSDADKQAAKIIDKAQAESQKSRQQLGTHTASRMDEAISSVISSIID
ncbi:MAG: hypothetical protein PHR24_03090 [Oscillospiraceae bacterium]|nr:hypothetical protein [Oscillospiraceae bacterium]MDD3832738.1 hypothetical protein [Oscillospiraceae bacterium]MDD4546261.1 hypothetical protein [Oscillospiraceae bacterium]